MDEAEVPDVDTVFLVTEVAERVAFPELVIVRITLSLLWLLIELMDSEELSLPRLLVVLPLLRLLLFPDERFTLPFERLLLLCRWTLPLLRLLFPDERLTLPLERLLLVLRR